MLADRLFRASCIALVATAMSFAIRGDIRADFERAFGLSKTEVGWIAGAAFWGFGLSTLIGGPLCDVLGMRALSRLATAGHVLGTLATIAAPAVSVLFAATLVIGIANGLVEAFVLTQLGLGWQAKMLLLLVPTAVYTVMFTGQPFPRTEGTAAGIPLSAAFKEIGRPLFLVVWLCMWVTAATELGPGQWYANIFDDVMGSGTQTGVILLVWVNGTMYLVRQFFGDVPHRVSPTLLIAVTAPVAAAGLYLFGFADTPALWFVAAALLAVGTAFWWPTMIGMTSERFPRGGALLLAIVGASGAIATAIAGPVMGWINDVYGASAVLPTWAFSRPCWPSSSSCSTRETGRRGDTARNRCQRRARSSPLGNGREATRGVARDAMVTLRYRFRRSVACALRLVRGAAKRSRDS